MTRNEEAVDDLMKNQRPEHGRMLGNIGELDETKHGIAMWMQLG